MLGYISKFVIIDMQFGMSIIVIAKKRERESVMN